MKKPAIFIDRDGTLIHEKHYLSKLEDIQFYDDVAGCLKQLKDAGYWLIVITNQSGVSRGYFPEKFVDEAYQSMNEILGDTIQLDGQFYCPHRIPGNPPYNIKCDCRKPETGMIDQAEQAFEIDLENSFMLGDKLCDVQLAENKKIQGIMLLTGHGEEEEEKVRGKLPHIPIFENFRKATQFILEQNQKK